MKLQTTIPYVVLSFPLMLGNVLATPDESKLLGTANLFTINSLPASHLKNRLNSLSAPARQKAMQRLRQFNFPMQDIDSLSVDNQGAIFYQDEFILEEGNDDEDGQETEFYSLIADITPVDAFNLHSKPGSVNTVYLNFKGFTLSDTAWNSYTSVLSYQAVPFDTNNDPDSFSTAERRSIAAVWYRIAEDLAPFDIDVTTEEPLMFGPTTGHILITHNNDANGVAMPSNAKGIAYLNVWGQSNYEFFQPALVYYSRLSKAANKIAEAASHEFGHNLGLLHDGGSSTYYRGHGSGLTSWAPIMGTAWDKNVTQWSQGEYDDSSNPEDDLAIIGNKLQYRIDDHANTIGLATPLLVETDGVIASTTPETDPLNQYPDNKGIIETRSDVDNFYFDSESGILNIAIKPAWDTFTPNEERWGANLDLRVTLYDGIGLEIASSDPIDNADASISENLPSGRYYLAIEGAGNAGTPYSDYGSVGQYYISGTVVTFRITRVLTSQNIS